MALGGSNGGNYWFKNEPIRGLCSVRESLCVKTAVFQICRRSLPCGERIDVGIRAMHIGAYPIHGGRRIIGLANFLAGRFFWLVRLEKKRKSVWIQRRTSGVS